MTHFTTFWISGIENFSQKFLWEEQLSLYSDLVIGLMSGVLFLAGAWIFSFCHHIQTGSEVHPVSSSVGIRVSLAGDKVAKV